MNVLPLDTKEASLDIVGGKGRSLARLASLGMAVPGGFHLITAAYERFVDANDLQSSILDMAKPTVDQGILSFEAASARIYELFEKANIPEEIVGELYRSYAELGAPEARVAVRSSANAEDLPDMSFAGQQETFLNVRGEAALLAAVRGCWASLWTARALSYRHQMGIDQGIVKMAVVVQLMVDAEVSGILFTANPATGERSEVIINASFGLGEAVVSGQVTPDTYVVDRSDLQVKETLIGAKEQMIVSEEVGTASQAVALDRRDVSSLAVPRLKALVELALRVEQSFGGLPQDIEWSVSDDKIWLLQSRPITNLPPAPLKEVRWDPPEPNAYLGRSQLVEHIPDPVSTLFEDLHMKRSLQHFWGMNLSSSGRHDFEDTQPPASFVIQTTINGYAYRQVGEPPRSGRLPGEQEKKRRLPAPLNALLARLRSWGFQFRLNVLFVPKWRYVSLPRYLREINRWRQLDPSAATTEQLWKGIRALSQADARYWYGGGVWNAFALTRGSEFQLDNFLQTNAPGTFTTGQFLSGLKSMAFNGQLALWRIAEQIRATDALYETVVETPPKLLVDVLSAHPHGGTVSQALDAYFDEYGHQIFTLDFAEPSEGEAPANIIQSLHSLVLQHDYDPLERQRELAEQRKKTEQEANALFRGSSKRQFRWFLWKARHFYPNREEAMFHMGRAWTVLRPFARELGKRLVSAGTLETADDIYFLDADELGRAIRAVVGDERGRARGWSDTVGGIPEYRELAVARRSLREARRSLTPPFHVPGPPPWAKPEDDEPGEKEQDANVLKGSAVSPGKVTARVSRIMSPADFNTMVPGTILVCPATTPAWTQLFPQAKGLVTDIGGILAHGSIVAREYGIPAVLGLGDATKRIEHGQTITVDGDKGTVTIIESEDKGDHL